MIKKSLQIFLLFIIFHAKSQEIKDYTWDEKPVFAEVPAEYKNQAAVVLLDRRWVHTRVGQYAFANFVMNHTAIKINKAEEINNYNKIKAEDGGRVRDLRDFHARIIKPNGQINVLSSDKIVEVESDKIKSIVFEGVEAGDILEYYFILKENPSSYSVEIFQREIPVLKAEFIHTRYGVIFEIFSSDLFSKGSDNDKEIETAINIPPYFKEKNAANIKNLVKLIYMITVPPTDYYQWNNFFITHFSKPSFQYFKKNQAREFIENLNVGAVSTDEKVIKIDNYIKTNFEFVAQGETAKKVKNLGDGKQKLKASDIFDLYGFAFKELEIPYLICVGMSRFLGNVDSQKYVVPLSHEFMYYIPETQKFVSPYEQYLCYGFPMYELQSSKGILFTPRKRGESLTSIDFPKATADYTKTETNSTLTLSADLSSGTVEKSLAVTGYAGQLNRNYYRYLIENKEDKELADFVKNRTYGEDTDFKITTHNIENDSFDNNQKNNPFVIKIKGEIGETMTETAGNLTLVNLGKLIGQQSELYQETDRKFDIDLDYAKSYAHKIVFNIPKNFEVESYKDLIIDKKTTDDPKTNCSFKSTAEIVGNQLIIMVVESYNGIHYSKKEYPEYRKVINAAADFSKAAVVLKPKI